MKVRLLVPIVVPNQDAPDVYESTDESTCSLKSSKTPTFTFKVREMQGNPF